VEFFLRRPCVDDLLHDLGDLRLAVGVAVLKDLRRLAVEPVGQFLNGLHVAGRSLFDARACDFAQFFQVLAGRGQLHAQGLTIGLVALLTSRITNPGAHLLPEALGFK